MLPSLPGPTQQYLSDLQNINSEMTTLTSQMSSGLRVNSVSDDPSVVENILLNQARITQLTQTQTNLNNLTPELQAGDNALSQAMQNVEGAISIASQASSISNSTTSFSALTTQVQGILTNLVNLSNTNANGRYIFSGDLDQQPLYQLDSSVPTGVAQLATASSTRSVTDANGVQVWLSKTSSDIFDARNPDGTPASNNVFAAVNTLLTALQNNDKAGAIASISNLQAADQHLNQELGYYGIGESRVSDTQTSISNELVSVQTNQSKLRDTDLATAAVQLQQLTVQQQAALSARSKITGMNLFNFLA